ncbi:MAG: hypothetical protein N3G21_06915 [Candidatus Hydrogenedentes bacterium]|nr:hypothetical protein [Candidatus Hydrogenedentota bacterium]
MTRGLKERFEKFCELLEEQAELQETLVSVCLAQLQMGIEGDLSKLNEKTSAIVFLTKEISNIDGKIKAEISNITLGGKSNFRRMSELVSFFPEPWGRRAKESLERIKVSLLYLREWSKEALAFYKSAIRARQEILKVISPESVRSAVGYSDLGRVDEVNTLPRFMDRKG